MRRLTFTKFGIAVTVAALAAFSTLYARAPRVVQRRMPARIAVETATSGDEVVMGRVLVKLRRALRPEVRAVMQQYGVTLEALLEGGVEMISVPPYLPADLLAEGFAQFDEVEFAEPDYVVHLDSTVNDPQQRSQWYLQKVHAPEAWNVSEGLSTTIIAVCDTGADPLHPDLQGKLVPGHNVIANNTDTTDDNGHGTHVAGIAAAETNNGIGVAGVGYRCSVMPVKVLDASGTGTWSEVIQGVQYAVAHGARVINLSLGGTVGSLTLKNALNQAVRQGCLVVAAAGNANSTAEHFPAAYDACIAVGATTPSDARASFSNYGAAWVDVAAPGTSLYATFPTYSVTLGNYSSGYASLSGTSMSAPVVSGVAGLLCAYLGQSATPASVRSLIESTCDPVAATWTAFGRVDAGAALARASAPAAAKTAAPRNIVVKSGRWKGGDISSVAAADSNHFQTLSQGSRGTRFMEVECDLDGLAGSLTSLEVAVFSKASLSATQTISVYNWSRRRFDAVDTSSLPATLYERRVDLSNLAASYVKNGLLRIRVRGESGAAFTHAIDVLSARALGY